MDELSLWRRYKRHKPKKITPEARPLHPNLYVIPRLQKTGVVDAVITKEE